MFVSISGKTNSPLEKSYIHCKVVGNKTIYNFSVNPSNILKMYVKNSNNLVFNLVQKNNFSYEIRGKLSFLCPKHARIVLT